MGREDEREITDGKVAKGTEVHHVKRDERQIVEVFVGMIISEKAEIREIVVRRVDERRR